MDGALFEVVEFLRRVEFCPRTAYATGSGLVEFVTKAMLRWPAALTFKPGDVALPFKGLDTSMMLGSVRESSRSDVASADPRCFVN